MDNISPEQITGRVILLKGVIVSAEAICKFIWHDKKRGGLLHTYLRHQGRKYRKRESQKDSHGILKNQISIDLRPEVVEQKARFGDLEIDTVIGKNHKGALLSINDRCTGIVWIRKLLGKEAESLVRETINALLPFKHLIQTITADNGK